VCDLQRHGGPRKVKFGSYKHDIAYHGEIMGSKKTYDGYESFQYLEAGTDFQTFELPDDYQWGDPYLIELTEEEEARAAAVAADHLVFSLHDHPVYVPRDMAADFQDYSSEGRLFTAYDALAESPLDGVFDNIGLSKGASRNGMKMADVLYELGTRSTDVAHQDLLVKAGSVADVRRAFENDQIAWVPAVETARMIENELDRIEVLFGAGIRKLGITYSESNALGSGLGETRDAGLTRFGERAVERMNDVGMAIGLSHASDQTTLDVCELSEDPVFLSHNGAQALLNVPRLDPDEVLTAVADTGGVVAITAAPHNSATYETPRHSIESAMEHFEYVRDLVGIDHVSLGPDAMYGDHRGLHRLFDSGPPEGIVDVEYVKGMDNPTEAWHNFVRYLVRAGYDDDEIAKVLGENTLRALGEIWP
jgi:membrane dipeptidase